MKGTFPDLQTNASYSNSCPSHLVFSFSLGDYSLGAYSLLAYSLGAYSLGAYSLEPRYLSQKVHLPVHYGKDIEDPIT